MAIYTVEMKAIFLGEVLWVWDLDDLWFPLCALLYGQDLVGCYLGAEDRSYPSYDANAHLGNNSDVRMLLLTFEASSGVLHEEEFMAAKLVHNRVA